MTGRQRPDGWAGLVDDEAPPSIERPSKAPEPRPSKPPPEPRPSKPPPEARPSKAPPQKSARPDPVLAAMRELDGEDVVPRSATPRGDTDVDGKPPAPSRPPPKSGLRLPVPGQDASGLGLATPSGGAEPAPAAPPVAGFSETDLLERMAAEAPSKPKRSIWRTYRELIVTSIVGTIALIGVIVWQATKPAEEEELREPVRFAPIQAPPQRLPEPQVTPPTEPKSLEGRPQKASAPMLTIVSNPPGALVEIDGLVRGKTPLIMPRPENRSTLRVRLSLERHQGWEGTLEPNSAGHITANIRLKPR